MLELNKRGDEAKDTLEGCFLCAVVLVHFESVCAYKKMTPFLIGALMSSAAFLTLLCFGLDLTDVEGVGDHCWALWDIFLK